MSDNPYEPPNIVAHDPMPEPPLSPAAKRFGIVGGAGAMALLTLVSDSPLAQESKGICALGVFATSVFVLMGLARNK